MFGHFGSSISDALSTEFFQWFHLEKTGESHDGDISHQRYQPTAPQFHDLVQVTISADRNQSLRGVQMSIRRSFIDSPRDFTMAADILKSFLMAALEPDDVAAIHDALTQIRRYNPSSSAMATMTLSPGVLDDVETSTDDAFEAIKRSIDRGEPAYANMRAFKIEGGKMVPVDDPKQGPLLPGEGEPAYLAYIGKRRQLELRLNYSLLQMANGNASGVEQFVISVTPV
jgi:hypothetical protein